MSRICSHSWKFSPWKWVWPALVNIRSLVNPRKFSPRNLIIARIRESFLPRKFSAIRYLFFQAPGRSFSLARDRSLCTRHTPKSPWSCESSGPVTPSWWRFVDQSGLNFLNGSGIQKKEAGKFYFRSRAPLSMYNNRTAVYTHVKMLTSWTCHYWLTWARALGSKRKSNCPSTFLNSSPVFQSTNLIGQSNVTDQQAAWTMIVHDWLNLGLW